MKFTKSTITISDIEIYAYHGVYEHERTNGNRFLVSVTLDFDATGAMRYDDLNLTINYAEVVNIIKDTMVRPSQLLENVAYRITMALKEAFPILQSGTVSVTKVHPPFNIATGGATFTASFCAIDKG